LNLSPMLLEKYMKAADVAMKQAVPLAPRIPDQTILGQKEFSAPDLIQFGSGGRYAATFNATKPGSYEVVLQYQVLGEFEYDAGKADISFKIDGKEELGKRLQWMARFGGKGP